MAAQQTSQHLVAQLLEWTKLEQIDRVEECWIEQIGTLPNQTAFYKEWIKAMRRAGAADRAESLLGLVIEDRLSVHKIKAALRLLLVSVPYYPQSTLFRPQLVQALRAFNGDVEQCDELLKLAGVDGAKPLPEAFQAFQEWIKLTPGQVYQHYDWGEGVVQELDPVASKVTLAFESDPARVMTVDGVRKYLKYIEPGSFLAQRTKDPDQLRKQADDAPVEVIKLVLASQPNKQIKQGELKALITPGVVPAEQWNGWWSKAREGLKLDPYVDFDASGGAHSVLQLRDQPRTFEQEIEERFFAEDATTSLRAELIRQIAKRPKDAPLPVALIGRMADQLKRNWTLSAQEGLAVRLEIAYMMEDLAAVMQGCVRPPADEPLLAEIRDYRVLFEMDNVDYGIRAIDRLLKRDGDAGSRQAAELLPEAPVKLAQAIWQALDEERHLDLAVAALQKLFARPMENPDTYAWAVRATADGSWDHLGDYFPVTTLIPEVLDEMELWQRIANEPGSPEDRVTAAKALLSRMRTLLGANKLAIIARVVQSMSRESINRLRHQIQVHGALPTNFKDQVERVIRITRRDLEESQSGGRVPSDDDELMCTARAYAEKAQELRLITSVKIPKNSRIIEEARMEGDLSENAGYQYAKEEQKMLMQQSATLTDQLSRARVVHPNQVDDSVIGFGTEFRAFNRRLNQEETYTILGRWEANPDRHILSRQAPLAQQFAGHKVGDTVTIKHPGGGQSEYEVLAIENALASGEWDTKTQAEGPEA